MVLAFMFLLLDHQRNKTLNVTNMATDATPVIDIMTLLSRTETKSNVIFKLISVGMLHRICLSARRDP